MKLEILLQLIYDLEAQIVALRQTNAALTTELRELKQTPMPTPALKREAADAQEALEAALTGPAEQGSVKEVAY